jgi:hypothetical protein
MIPQSEINEAAQFLTDKSGANPSHAVLCEECVRLRRENEELQKENSGLSLVQSVLKLWIETKLGQLEYKSTGSGFGKPMNGFAFSAVPDWELRQKLEPITEGKSNL